ncbi:MAG TPA: CocE/NonD family hydrolase [Thermomicrobiales bacterium]|nr:CocE/NonD family hydrolase [Thermomicrobiales bacterium]
MADEPRHAVNVLRDVLIPMPDGARLAGNLFLPDAPGAYPGLLTLLPYLKDSPPRRAREAYYRHFASRGYAVMLVDVRGTGNSEGGNPGPQAPQEARDGQELVEWMARQAWCTGGVGVWGVSNGGNTAISIAATRPPHLRAIIPIHGSHDTYDWFFRPNGCCSLLYADGWGLRMAASNLVPPLLQDAEGRWERAWRERLEGQSPWILAWHGEPPEPEFAASRRVPYRRIEVPTFVISGWRDAYRSPMLEVFAAVDAPKRLLVGPWKHESPDQAAVVPIGAVHEMDRWWDRWLKGIRNGVEDEPPVAIFVQRTDEGDGSWRSEPAWPIERTEMVPYYLHAEGELQPQDSPRQPGVDTYVYDSRGGAGSLGFIGSPGNVPVPRDQSVDDLLSLIYTTAPVDHDLEITGSAVARVYLAATAEESNLVAKLCVVQPDGSSQLITHGWVNTARASSRDAKVPLPPGEVREVMVVLRPTSRVIAKGQRIRLAISGSDFPELWPTPVPYTMQVFRGSQRPSRLDLPIIPPPETEAPSPRFSPPLDTSELADGAYSQSSHQVRRDLVNRVVTYETESRTLGKIDEQTTMADHHWVTMSTDADRPWDTSVRAASSITIQRPAAETVITVDSHLTPYQITMDAKIREDGRVMFSRNWTKRVTEG